MATPNWKQFERLVAAIHHVQSVGAEVKWNDLIDGRQFDVAIRFKHGLHEYLTVVECKSYAGKVSADKVDAFVTKSRDINANKAIMVSSNGYQPACVAVAKRHGISLLVLNERISIDNGTLLREVTPALNIFEVVFENAETADRYEFEEFGGRLDYLMEQCVVRANGAQQSPRQIVDDWQMNMTDAELFRMLDQEIHLGSTAELTIPFEDPVAVTLLRFKCRLVNAFVASDIGFDRHIRQAEATRYELSDVNGEVQHVASLADIPLGYDMQLEVGKFYFSPTLSAHYYCTAIVDDIASWILVESYQHGILVQMEFTQKIQYAKFHTEVTDVRALDRLKKMLDNFDAKSNREMQ